MNLKDKTGGAVAPYLRVPFLGCAINCKVKLLIFETRPIFQPIGVGFLMIYWILFGIWATVKAYHLRRSNVGWVAIFFVLNVVGYLLNIIYYRFKVDSVE